MKLNFSFHDFLKICGPLCHDGKFPPPITRSLHRSHLNKGCICTPIPVTMLQNWKNVQCSIGILCVTFSTSIPSSDK